MSYEDFMKKIEKVHSKLERPPYHGHFGLNLDGSFDIKESTTLMPEEALKLGKWLVDFYKDADL